MAGLNIKLKDTQGIARKRIATTAVKQSPTGDARQDTLLYGGTVRGE